MKQFTHKKTKTNGKVEFLQSYHVVATDVLLEIGTATTSVDFSLEKHL
jgi:hypothetical protein